MIRVGLAIDQHKIRPNVAVAVIFPLAGQLMIVVMPGQFTIRRQRSNDAPEFGVQDSCVPPAPFPPVVPLES